MARISEIINMIESFCPTSHTMPDFEDNVGLLVGSSENVADKAIVCLDATEEVVLEAIACGAKLIISHHPVIFRPLKSVNDSTPIGKSIVLALENGISIYSAHTNLDFCEGGINDYNAKLLGLCDVSALFEINSVKIGRVGTLDEQIPFKQFVSKVSNTFGSNVLCLGGKDKLIGKVAVVNGSGGDIDYIERAKELGAECYISAEFSHHVLLHAKATGINVIEMRHYDMEQIYISEFVRLLKAMAINKNISVDIMQSKNENSPIWIKE